ncbi:MAG: BspA family leucine-rich repeat surface protein [Flavobacteriaceae bacterium]
MNTELKIFFFVFLTLSLLQCEDKLEEVPEVPENATLDFPNSNPKIYMDVNEVTIRCPEAKVGERGTIQGKEYLVVTEETLRESVKIDADLTCFCTSLIQNMAGLFSNKKTFNQDISGWDTSNVTDMRRMFFYSALFNQGIGEWDTSSVTDMRGMFTYAFSFNQSIGEWKTAGVTLMSSMFEYAESFDQDLSDWCVDKIDNPPEHFSVGSPLSSDYQPFWGTCPP